MGYLVVLFSLFLVLSILVSLSMGYLSVPTPDILFIILHKLTGLFPDIRFDPTHLAVVWDIRLPRILTCVCVGAALALSGVIFQGILLNPLADPYTLGVSAGAAFGASVAILLNLGAAAVSVPLFAFAGAGITLLFVISLSFSSQNPMAGLSSNNLILLGIIVAAILSAGISFLKFVANEQVSVIIFWLMGSFASRTWANATAVFIFLLAGAAVALFYSRDLNLISLGPKSAASLGVNMKKTMFILLISGSLVAAVCVSVSGIIGFIGLLVPHMIRMISGPDNRKLIPLSMISGGTLLLWADTLTRAVLPHEIPIGVLTALLGGPVFCWIFKKSRKG